MCGIAGFIDHKNRILSPNDTIRTMIATMNHRGPDGDGIWTDNNRGIAVGHKRLSIQDLSEEGKQPMFSASGRYIIVFNGEVYNYRILSRQLTSLGYSFRGHSDTEVMLAAFEEWGIEGAINRFIGMFAFALVDLEKNQLYLARDRIGIKPLYYGEIDSVFVFASELKAIRKLPGFNGNIDRNSLALFLGQNDVPGKYSIYQNVNKLLPGHLLTYDLNTGAIIVKSYWSVEDVANESIGELDNLSDDEAVGLLEETLKDSIKLRMLADVPVGAFLSGGIDSSLVASLMQDISADPINTYSIGFYDEKYNEAPFAKEIANHIGSHHTELYVKPEEALAVIPKLPEIYDEPFGDPSQIPTYLVSKMASDHVTVSLSGDGGDELFYGYDRYAEAAKLWKNIKWLPSRLRHMSGTVISQLNILDVRKINTLASMLKSIQSMDDVYRFIMLSKESQQDIVLGGKITPFALTKDIKSSSLTELHQHMMLYDQMCYLPDDILVKMDRASMAVSLEARVPLLDHRVIELAWKLPQRFKYRDGKEKWILKEVLGKYVPQEMYDRPKRGFAIPLGPWLCGPLKDWAERLLDEQRLKDEGYFDVKKIRNMWSAYQSGTIMRNNFFLWSVLMFQAWLDHNKK